MSWECSLPLFGLILRAFSLHFWGGIFVGVLCSSFFLLVILVKDFSSPYLVSVFSSSFWGCFLFLILGYILVSVFSFSFLAIFMGVITSSFWVNFVRVFSSSSWAKFSGCLCVSRSYSVLGLITWEFYLPYFGFMFCENFLFLILGLIEGESSLPHFGLNFVSAFSSSL